MVKKAQLEETESGLQRPERGRTGLNKRPTRFQQNCETDWVLSRDRFGDISLVPAYLVVVDVDNTYTLSKPPTAAPDAASDVSTLAQVSAVLIDWRA
jgi:hypothetical protein